jgi:8-oxo-dGTP diphosphatase
MCAATPVKTDNARQRVHVAVAAVVNVSTQVLITRRHESAHQGGLWEFPGGKLEPREPVVDALNRELHEELGIRPLSMRPLIRIAHDYDDKSVLLDTWRIDAYAGEATPREGQPLQWVPIADLDATQFPAANRGIIKALQLAPHMLITPDLGAENPVDFVQTLSASLRRHELMLVQLRVKNIGAHAYRELAHHVLRECTSLGAELILNSDPRMLHEVDARGVHIPGTDLAAYRQRPVGDDKYLSVSVHDEREIELASRLDPDFVLLSPVKATASHRQARPLGWKRFNALAAMFDVPVYALGGLQSGDVDMAQRNGAQGIAAISAFWCGSTGR